MRIFDQIEKCYAFALKHQQLVRVEYVLYALDFFMQNVFL